VTKVLPFCIRLRTTTLTLYAYYGKAVNDKLHFIIISITFQGVLQNLRKTPHFLLKFSAKM